MNEQFPERRHSPMMHEQAKLMVAYDAYYEIGYGSGIVGIPSLVPESVAQYVTARPPAFGHVCLQSDGPVRFIGSVWNDQQVWDAMAKVSIPIHIPHGDVHLTVGSYGYRDEQTKAQHMLHTMDVAFPAMNGRLHSHEWRLIYNEALHKGSVFDMYNGIPGSNERWIASWDDKGKTYPQHRWTDTVLTLDHLSGFSIHSVRSLVQFFDQASQHEFRNESELFNALKESLPTEL